MLDNKKGQVILSLILVGILIVMISSLFYFAANFISLNIAQYSPADSDAGILCKSKFLNACLDNYYWAIIGIFGLILIVCIFALIKRFRVRNQ